MLNDLETIITGAGEYITRDGRRVTIHKVVTPPDSGTTSFAAKGAVWVMLRGKMRPKGFNVWHLSGRAYPLAESAMDIVGLWPAASPRPLPETIMQRARDRGDRLA